MPTTQVSAATTVRNDAGEANAAAVWTNNISANCNKIVLTVFGWDNDPTGLTFSATLGVTGNPAFVLDRTALLTNGNDRWRCSILYCDNISLAIGTKPIITVTPSQAAYFTFAMLEMSGKVSGASEAGNTNNSGTSTTSPNPGAITTLTANNTLVGVYIGADTNPQTHDVPAGFTEYGEVTDNNNDQAGTMFYRDVTTIQSAQTFSLTTTNSRYACCIAAYADSAASQDTPELYGDMPGGLRRSVLYHQLLGGF